MSPAIMYRWTIPAWRSSKFVDSGRGGRGGRSGRGGCGGGHGGFGLGRA